MASRFQRATVTADTPEEVTELEPEILYEFITYAEWQQDPELLIKGYTNNPDDQAGNRNTASARGRLWSLLRTSLSSYVPADVSQHINNRDAWQFAVGGKGKVVAILEDHSIEIRSSKDEYGSIIGKCSISRDPFPQWRKLTWSPCCGLLAASYSNGAVDFFDVLGSKLFAIESESLPNKELGEAIVNILFIDTRVKKSKWSYEVIIINFKGELRSYFVSSTDGYKLYHEFSFSKFYSCGVTAALYHQSFNMLICSGLPDSCFLGNRGKSKGASTCGITAWRLQSDYPYYKLSLSLEDEEHKAKSSTGIFQRLSGLASPKRENSDVVVKLSLSPEALLMVAVHVSGSLSFWDIPSLRLRQMFPLLDQPNFDAQNNTSLDYLTTKNKNNVCEHGKLKFHPTDVNWWSDKAVIVGRYSGCLSVASIKSLNNLLGSSVEWFESPPQISESFDRGFLVMECENQISSKRRSVSRDPDEREPPLDEPNESSDDDDEDATIVRKSGKWAKTLLYYITDSERFQPTRKRSKVLTKTYRLMCLKSTTPEELFARKIDDEEYGEALELARSYGLDSDVVYRRQWKNSAVSVTTIQDYLRKISKRAWVLHECLDRVAESVEATRALLEYGLYGTELQVLINIQDGTDEGKFISYNPNLKILDESLDAYVDKPKEAKKETAKDARKILMDKINFEKLNLEQKYLCQTRYKFLQYLDRLTTYEIMLGGPAHADEHFDHNFFRKFRSMSALEAAIEFSRQGNWQYVAAMFTYHGNETLPQRLAILSNFPEVISPFVYRSLLPEICQSPGNKPTVYTWVQEVMREVDWVETKICMKGADLKASLPVASELTESYSELSSCREVKLTPLTLSNWYMERASQIEATSRLVNHALDLITLGIERNVKGLEIFYNDLLTMEVLVYECYIDDVITFDHLREMDSMALLNLMMSVSSEDNFVKNVKKWLLPFLDRLEKQKPGNRLTLLRAYMLSLAVHDLTRCVKIFENSRTECQPPVIDSVGETIQLALDCIYANQNSDQLKNASAILECLPQRGYGERSKKMDALHDRLDVLEKHLGAAEVLEKNGVTKSIAFIRDIERDADQVRKLFVLLTRVSSRKNVKSEKSQWRELLEDVIELQRDVFHCIDTDACAEIFAESLLCAGNRESIELAGELFPRIQRADSGESRGGNLLSVVLPFQKVISEERAVRLVISAAQEYFNSASNYDDTDIDLARQCLKLMRITDDSSIQAELDLIDALPILNELGLTILPSQVRLCENRLKLIEDVFKINMSAYRYAQKLMKLAHLLRVGQDVHLWEENVYILISTAAFQAKDYNACHDACHNLVHRKCSRGWEICLELGQCDDFDDVRARYDLLAFVTVYCTDDRIEDIIRIRNRLDTYMIHHQLLTDFDVNLFSEESTQETKESSGRFPKILDIDPINQTKKLATHLRQFTTDTTKNVLTAVGGKVDFLKNTVSWAIPNLSSLTAQDSGSAEANSDLSRVAVPTFYASLFDDCVASRQSPSYSSYAVPAAFDPPLTVHMLMHRLALLASDDKPRAKQILSPNVIRDMAVRLLPLDSMLGLAYVLKLDDPALIDECFQKFPISDSSLRLVMYALALHVCRRQGDQSMTGDKNQLYRAEVDDVIKRALRFVGCKTSDRPDDKLLLGHSKLLRKYEQKRQDFVQARLLQSIDKGVDVLRFSNDDLYKHDTVIGLIMTTDDRIYKIAVSLAHRYSIPLWDVYESHLIFLFAEQDLKVAAIEKRVNDLGLLPVLLGDNKRFSDSLRNQVFVTIAGENHLLLQYYFTLLEKCNPKSKELQSHLSLIRKLTNIAKGLDYKKLVDEQHDVLTTLGPILTASNVAAVAKLSPLLSTCCKQQINASQIHVTWLLKYMFEDMEGEDGAPMTHQKWLQRYNVCNEYFSKLEPRDLLAFLQGVLFVEKSLIYLPGGTRSEIMKRMRKYAKAEAGNGKEDKRQGWTDCLEQLEKCAQHLQWMQSESVTALLDSDDPVVQHYLRDLELSQSRPDRIHQMLRRCVLAAHPLAMLQQLIGVCPPQVSVSAGEIVIDCLALLRQSLSGNDLQEDCDLLRNKNVAQVLEHVGENIIQYLSKGGDLVDANDVAVQLKSVCTDENVDSDVKLGALVLLERIYPWSVEGDDTLALYQSRVIVGSCWPDVQINPEDVGTDDSRETLVSKLLDRCRSLSELETIKKLLLHWPPLPSLLTSNPSENTWSKIMNLVLALNEETKLECLIDIVRETGNKRQLSIDCIKPILLAVMESKKTLHSIKISLLSHQPELFDIVMQHLTTSDTEDLCVDDEICAQLIKQNLVHLTVGSVLFKPVQEYAIQNLTFEETKVIASQLKSSGSSLEAASLLLISSGVPQNLRTLDASIFFLKYLRV